VFSIYPINTGPGTIIIQMVNDLDGKPGGQLIDEWKMSHDGSKTLNNHYIHLLFNSRMSEGIYWFRIIESGCYISTLTYNCQVKDTDKDCRYINANGDIMNSEIKYGLVR
jgi:hypothetical protein